MLPQSVQRWLIVLGLVIILVIGSSIYLSQQFNSSPNVSSSTKQRVFPTELVGKLNLNLNVIYHDSKDITGRTVFYNQKNDFNKTYNNSGIGELYEATSQQKRLSRVIGSFMAWDDVKNSKDRYMLLKDPKSDMVYTKIRVIFEPNNQVDKDNYTELAVENLTNGKVEAAKKLFVNMTLDETAKIIVKGDAVVVYTMFNTDAKLNNLPLLDAYGLPYAREVIIRRDSGISDINPV